MPPEQALPEYSTPHLSPAEIEELEYAAARRAYLQSMRKAQRGDDEEELP